MTATIFTPDGTRYHLDTATTGGQHPRRGDEVEVTPYGTGTVQSVRWVLNFSTDQHHVLIWLRDWRAA
jgi:hypothetical protein